MKLDTTQPGLSALFFTHQGALLRKLFEETTPRSPGLGSRYLWEWVNEYLEEKGQKKVSRATCINALMALVDEKILTYDEESCKGGHRRLFKTAMTPAYFERLIENIFTNKLREIFRERWWRTDH